MRALLWKKINEVQRRKGKLLAVILIPIVTVIMVWFMSIDIHILFLVLPMVNIFFYWVMIFNVEDFVYAEVLFQAGIDIWDLWLMNITLIIVLGTVISLLQLLCYSMVMYSTLRLSITHVFHFISSVILGSGLIAFSTCYISDYSRVRNIVSSLGGIMNLVILGYAIVTKGQMTFIRENIVLLLAITITLGGIGTIVVGKFSEIEAFINNMRTMNERYDNTYTND